MNGRSRSFPTSRAEPRSSIPTITTCSSAWVAPQMPIPAMMNGHSGDRDHRFRASRSLIGAKRRNGWSSLGPSCAVASSSYALLSSVIDESTRPVERCGRRVLGAVQRPCGKRVLCVFHRSGTIHRLFGRSATAQEAPGTTIVRRNDCTTPPHRRHVRPPGHPFPFAPRRVAGSRIVGPFKVRRCA